MSRGGSRYQPDRSLAGTLRYAPPEQRNELEAEVGPYSDVYAWGKTCLDLLFGTTEPKSIHWKKLPDEYRERLQALLERATLDDIENADEHQRRFRGFETVLTELTGLLLEQGPSDLGAGSVREEPGAAKELPVVVIVV